MSTLRKPLKKTANNELQFSKKLRKIGFISHKKITFKTSNYRVLLFSRGTSSAVSDDGRRLHWLRKRVRFLMIYNFRHRLENGMNFSVNFLAHIDHLRVIAI